MILDMIIHKLKSHLNVIVALLFSVSLKNNQLNQMRLTLLFSFMGKAFMKAGYVCFTAPCFSIWAALRQLRSNPTDSLPCAVFCSCRSCSRTCQMTCWKTAETPPQSWITPPAAIKTPPIGKHVDSAVFAEGWMCYYTAINTLSTTLLPCSPQSAWTPQWSADPRSNSQQKVRLFK